MKRVDLVGGDETKTRGATGTINYCCVFCVFFRITARV